MTVHKLLRIYTDESAFSGDRRLFEVIAERARDAGLAGATVLDARLGFGRSAHVRRRHILENERSVVIEIIDEEAKLRSFVASLAGFHGIGLITVEAIELIFLPTEAA
ncbi:DUF190 domain-containing protein [Sphingomonas sp. KRR8]|uniref:DUF190 domain-containing protein n=1 Tax=Sphingomonas sp. KRR8 TaxID=2942996 RepID=UPI002020FC3C|nr:DUF190 domain-containing protein [Sphingomonas sp. KRR8]URD61097.1 DUF190 domain-containing protein [Sphingomonas sp. KRR8]